MAYYVVRVGNDFIADGKSYTVQGEVFVPFASSLAKAKKYKTYGAAKRASQRKGENMNEHIVILKREESEGE